MFLLRPTPVFGPGIVYDLRGRRQKKAQSQISMAEMKSCIAAYVLQSKKTQKGLSRKIRQRATNSDTRTRCETQDSHNGTIIESGRRGLSDVDGNKVKNRQSKYQFRWTAIVLYSIQISRIGL